MKQKELYSPDDMKLFESDLIHPMKELYETKKKLDADLEQYEVFLATLLEDAIELYRKLGL
jgi:hypothetical protein